MCGFTGIWLADKEKQVSSELIREMTNVIMHRGPNDSGYFMKENIGMGFRRLSIIDLEGGHQPMSDQNKRATIVFNGEIYNFKQIKNELILKGYQFVTNSDTEVVLNLYLEFGEAFVDKLRGMFSIVIFDHNLNKLVLVRDRFGIKPLHYLINDNVLVFGSEIKSIIKSNKSNKKLDHTAIDSFFSYGYILTPYSIFSDIKKLTPGTLMSVELKNNSFKSTTTKYWKPTFSSNFNLSFTDHVEIIREKLLETVKCHLVSDVPIGAFLSGGIDSNAVVSTMIKLAPDKIRTFSIGFEEDGFDEAVMAKKSANFYGTHHSELYLESSSASLLNDIIQIYDEPFADTSAIPTYFVSQLAAKDVKVVLSGDGGDEFFGGYNDYQRLLKLNKYRGVLRVCSPLFKMVSRHMPRNMKGKRFLYALSHNPTFLHAMSMQFNNEEKNHFFSTQFYSENEFKKAHQLKIEHLLDSLSKDFISKQMELDIKTYMTDDILTKVDRASMANSLEVRVPLIDHEFFQVASSIPSSMKIKGGIGKYIFREAVKDQIPDFIYNRPKSGFTIPINKWFKDDLNEFAISSLEDAKQIGIINPRYIDELIKTRNMGGLVTRVWPIIVFSTWYKKNIN